MSGERETMSAADCKAKGNEFLKTKDFDTAISWYTTAIEKDNTQHGGYKIVWFWKVFLLWCGRAKTLTRALFSVFFFSSFLCLGHVASSSVLQQPFGGLLAKG